MTKKYNKPVSIFLQLVPFLTVASAVAVVSVLVFLSLKGYDINRSTGEVIKNGLVVVDSEPDGANIVIDNLPEGETTKSNLTLPEGKHSVSLLKEGYREWQKEINLVASNVVNLGYPRLMPENSVSAPTLLINKAAAIKRMPEQDKILVISFSPSSDDKIILQRYDVNDGKYDDWQSSIEISLDSLEVEELADLSFEIVDIYNDSSLIEFKSDDSNDYIVARLTNINEVSDQYSLESGSNIQLTGADSMLVSSDSQFTHTSQLFGKPINTVFKQKAIDYALTSDRSAILVAHSSDLVSIDISSGEESKLITTARLIDIEFLDVVEHDGKDVVILYFYDQGVASYYLSEFISTEPSLDSESIFMKSNVDWELVNSSPNGRFITWLDRAGGIVSYDLENNEFYTVEPSAGSVVDGVQWLDKFNMIITFSSNNELYVSDYDGKNQYNFTIEPSDINLGYFKDTNNILYSKIELNSDGQHVILGLDLEPAS